MWFLDSLGCYLHPLSLISSSTGQREIVPGELKAVWAVHMTSDSHLSKLKAAGPGVYRYYDFKVDVLSGSACTAYSFYVELVERSERSTKKTGHESRPSF